MGAIVQIAPLVGAVHEWMYAIRVLYADNSAMSQQ
jgi:hypothetical protein